MKRHIHYLKQKDFQIGTGKDAVVLCGKSSKDDSDLLACSMIELVDCEVCKERYDLIKPSQTLCSFCPTTLREEDYENPNDFYLSCHNHKALAQIATQQFFRQNPYYETWQILKA